MLKTNDLYVQKLEANRQRVESGLQKRIVSAAGSQGILDTDLLNGMRQSVRNSQQRLAMEYMAEIIEGQAAQIAELQELIQGLMGDKLPSTEESIAPPAPKPVPSRAKAKKAEEAPVEEEPAE